MHIESANEVRRRQVGSPDEDDECEIPDEDSNSNAHERPVSRITAVSGPMPGRPYPRAQL